MAILCKPATAFPEHVLTLDDTLALCHTLHSGHPRFELLTRLVRATGVRKRHFVLPVTRILRLTGFGARNDIYLEESRRRVPDVAGAALRHAGLAPHEVDAVVYASCTGVTMPPMSTWLINKMGMRPDTRQIPLSQLGCVAGAAAINRAHDFCLAYPDANVLVVACEFGSLLFQPSALDIGSLLCAGLFGDAIGAAVVRGRGTRGLRLLRNTSVLVPDTEPYISFDVTDSGPHVRLDKRVPETVRTAAPALARLMTDLGWTAPELEVCALHAGGPRILSELTDALGVRPQTWDESRETLAEYGNTVSVTLLEALRNLYASGRSRPGDRALIAGMGPGVSVEAALAVWEDDAA